ncbi:hypothetical protein BD413DRAFT_233197 [Trametes elegans]|nr:hypothetical protein BD413DRAFT_233197 [Trametes elegans]
MSSSIESDRGSIVNALHVFDRQDELARDYTCCGLNLNDLHALVDHFEECHVVVLDPYAPQQSLPQQASTSSMPSSAAPPVASYFPDSNGVASRSNQQAGQQQQQSISYQGFDPDDMELDVDQNASAPSSGAPSPPDTPVSTPLSTYPAYSHSALPSPALAHASQPASPISAFDTTTVLPSRAHHVSGFRSSMGSSGSNSAARAEDAFNAYAGYSDYSSLLPGAAPMGSGASAMFMQQQGQLTNMSLGPMNGNQTSCAPTALLLSNSTANTPDSTPASSRVASPIPGNATTYRNVAPSGSQNAQASSSTSGASSSNASGSSPNGANNTTPRASTTLSRPASSLLLSKPFRCPKPNCNKSYKQANGLKYHMTHGSCNFAPPKDLEHLQELLASKRSEKAAKAGENGTANEAEVTLSDAELREVEKEAERRLRPYACGVGDCQRRYKNMNGLRYHYQHSGDHGAIGLALLASGQHECLQHNKSHSRHATPSQSASASQSQPRTPTTPSSQSSFAQQQQATFSQPPSYQTASVAPPTYAYQPSASQQQQQYTQQPQQYAQPQQSNQQNHYSAQGYSMGMQQ